MEVEVEATGGWREGGGGAGRWKVVGFDEDPGRSDDPGRGDVTFVRLDPGALLVVESSSTRFEPDAAPDKLILGLDL